MSSTHALGRRPPTDWKHVDNYPLTAAETPAKPVPVVIGVNWYSAFDEPKRDRQGHWWIGRGLSLGRLRGGHCVCLKARRARDSVQRQVFYDQGSEGACVGFGISRMMTHLNGGKLYLARWIWDKAKDIDEWSDTNPGDNNGTSVRAALDVLRTQGHVPYSDSMARYQTDWVARGGLAGSAAEGISANRWIRSIDDCLDALGYGGLDYVDVMNSWGKSWPLLTRMPATVLETLWKEDGEIAIVTDR